MNTEHPLANKYLLNLELLADKYKCVLWAIDAHYEKILFVSTTYSSIWGRSPLAIYKDANVWKKYLITDEPDKIWDQCKSRDTLINPNHTVLYRIRLPKHNQKWLQDRSFHLNDSHGNCILIAGVAMPVTDKDFSKHRQELVSNKIDKIIIKYQSLLKMQELNNDVNQLKKQDKELNKLTKRQRQVIALLLKGMTSKQIADKLSLSARTVETHLNHIKLTLNCDSKSELIILAVEQNWLNINI